MRRLKTLREMRKESQIPPEQIAAALGITTEKYMQWETTPWKFDCVQAILIGRLVGNPQLDQINWMENSEQEQIRLGSQLGRKLRCSEIIL